MKAILSSETLVTTCNTAWRYKPLRGNDIKNSGFSHISLQLNVMKDVNFNTATHTYVLCISISDTIGKGFVLVNTDIPKMFFWQHEVGHFYTNMI
jgi:hypothetical protein